MGEIYSKEKLLKKTIRSLPVRFRAKVVVIEEAKDVTKMSFDDLVGSMQTYKMNLDATSKDKGLALKADIDSSESTSYSEEQIMMFTRKFGKLLRKSGKTPRRKSR